MWGDVPPKRQLVMFRVLKFPLNCGWLAYSNLWFGDFLAMITGRIRGEVEVWKCGSVSFWSWLLAIFGPRQDMTGILWMSNVENQVGGPLWVTPVDRFTICSLKNGALQRYPWLTIRSFKNGRIIAWLYHVIAHNHLMWVKQCHLHHQSSPFL